MSIIYKIINIINGKIYVGKHISADDNYIGSGLLLRQAIRKYGREKFKKEILEICSEEIVDQREIHWINKLNATVRGIGYNLTKGIKRPEEVRRRISKSRMGIIHSEEHRRKISKTLLGRKLPEITKSRMSKARKGIPQKKIKCPYCNKKGGTTMYRWHFENCKNKRAINND